MNSNSNRHKGNNPSFENATNLHDLFLGLFFFIYSLEIAAMKAQDMYLGVLFSMEDLSVYGYMTNTKIKFITVLTVHDVIIKDLDMKNVRNLIFFSIYLGVPIRGMLLYHPMLGMDS
jgi:hypothetical protein